MRSARSPSGAVHVTADHNLWALSVLGVAFAHGVGVDPHIDALERARRAIVDGDPRLVMGRTRHDLRTAMLELEAAADYWREDRDTARAARP